MPSFIFLAIKILIAASAANSRSAANGFNNTASKNDCCSVIRGF